MLSTHPHILEVAVVALNDEKWGEVPKAYITVKEGKEILDVHVIEWAKNHKAISKFMVPKEVEILQELPKTSTGKTRKNILRDWAKGKKREED